MRVARPGARIGLAVRAIGMPQWWSLSLPAEIKAKVEIPPQSVNAGGVADANLYARMSRAGLVDLRAFPHSSCSMIPKGPFGVTARITSCHSFPWPRLLFGALSGERRRWDCPCKPTRSIARSQRSLSNVMPSRRRQRRARHP
jgi:hypothetical protein